MPEINKLEILKSICTDTINPMTEKPFHVPAGGEIYEFGTDGRVLLAFTAQSSELPAIPATRTGETERRFIEWLSRKPAKKIVGRTARNMNFAEFLKLEGYRHCPACNGTGVRNTRLWHGEDSWYEIQNLDPFEKDRFVRLGSHPINANLLARTLAQLNWQRETEPIGYRSDWSAERKSYQHAFYGEGWILVLMGCREDDDYGDIPNWTEFQPIEGEAN